MNKIKPLETDIAAFIRLERNSLFRYACYKTGNYEDAEDILQNVFLKLYSDPDKILLIDNPHKYLYRSVSNECISYYRKKQDISFTEIEDAGNICEEQETDFMEEIARINRILSIIPEDQAEVIRLRTICEKSFTEIAEILEVPVTTIKSRFKYGIDKVRSEFFKPESNHKK